MRLTQTLGPCTECGTPRDACTAPDYCCEECLHFPPDWDGYAPTQRAEPTGDVREQIAEAVATAGDGYWARADAVLALPAVRDALAAEETVWRVALVIKGLDSSASLKARWSAWSAGHAAGRAYAADRIRSAVVGALAQARHHEEGTGA